MATVGVKGLTAFAYYFTGGCYKKFYWISTIHSQRKQTGRPLQTGTTCFGVFGLCSPVCLGLKRNYSRII